MRKGPPLRIFSLLGLMFLYVRYGNSYPFGEFKGHK